MNTKYKFRIWDKMSKCYVSSYEKLENENRLKFFIGLDGSIGKIIYPLNGNDGKEDNIINPENYEIEQWSGCVDADGVEIYEGDIIEYCGREGIIENHSGCFYAAWDDQTDDEVGYLVIANMVVIGNIHNWAALC